MEIINRILNLIKQRGITPHKLEVEAGLSISSIQAWKNRKAKPSVEAIIKISKYFNVSTDYLLTGEITMDNNKKILDNSKGTIFNSNFALGDNNTIGQKEKPDEMLDLFLTNWKNFSAQQKLYFVNLSNIEKNTSDANSYRSEQIAFLHKYKEFLPDPNLIQVFDLCCYLYKKGKLVSLFKAIYNFLIEENENVSDWLKNYIDENTTTN